MEVESDEEVSPDSRSDSSQGISLEDVKRQGRQLRSTHKEMGLFGGVMDDSPLQGLQMQPKQVGLLYDDRMLQHQNEWQPKEVEIPQRLRAIWDRCRYHRLLDRCLRIPIRGATEKEMSMVHQQDYITEIKNSANKDLEERKTLASKYDATYFNQSTYECVTLAAGGAIDLVDNILNYKIRNGFAIVRPPGHHAMEKDACGFCFVNNVSVAAKHATQNHGISRVLIVDLDVHHGHGTQYAFYDDPSVMYFSIHRYEYGEFWPNLRESDYDYIGEGRGRGYNINVPFNRTGMCDGDYMAAFQQILLPIAYQYNPRLVIVSCGYDALLGDPLGEFAVSPAGFAHLIHMLKPLADGKLALILEGGYCLKAMSEAAALSLRELLDDPPTLLDPLQPAKDSAQESILQVVRVLRPYWSCLAYQDDAECESELPPYFCDIEIPKPGVHLITPENRPSVYDIYELDPRTSKEVQKLLDAALERIISQTKLLSTIYKTCFVYEERMRLHKCTTSTHPERPDRITRIFDRHMESGLAQRCQRLKSRIATQEELLLVHEPKYVEEVREFQYKSVDELHEIERDFSSVYLSQEVYECSALAVGCTLNVVDSVLTGESENGVAIVRPPGHHAESAFCMGFCIFNNIAIAARYAQQKYGIKRVLILDWDVHHGNGTQNMFYDDPSVLYISLHRYDNGCFFPVGGEGCHDKVGEGKGRGFNVNIPWNGGSMGDAEYMAAFQQVVMPIVYQYSPELVLVSAGFDAARGDPLGGYKISPECYAHLTQMLKGLAMGRIILALEGGYNLYAISESMCMCTSVLLGDLCPTLSLQQPPCKSAIRSICDVQDTQKKFWSSLCFRVKIPSREETKSWLGDIEVNIDPQTAGQGDSVEVLTESLNRVKVEGQVSASPTEQGDSNYKLPSFDETFGQDTKEQTNNIEMSEDNKDRPSGNQNETTPTEVGSSREATADGATGGAVGGSVGDIKPGDDVLTISGETEKSVMSFLGAAVEGQDPSAVQMFAVYPKNWCEHLVSVKSVPERGLNVKDPCLECGHVGENWACLVCYEVHCSRYVNEHMLMHGIDKQHLMCLSYADLTVWCYGCDSYVHHQAIHAAKQSAHRSKFSEDMPTGS